MNDTSASPPSRSTTIEGIQWLRAVAALMVVTFHARYSVRGAETWPAVGAAGVDIFFIISGFVMAHTTRRLGDALTLPERLAAAGDFLRKRLARVVPLYWLALLWTARRELVQGQVGLDLVKDFAFLPHPNPSYPDMLWPVMIQGWTLNYEMFFYALFALALLCGRPRTVVLLGGLVLLVALGPVLAPAVTPSQASPTALWGDPAPLGAAARRFYTDNILLEFGLGVLLQKVLAARGMPHWPRAAFAVTVLVGFVLLALGQDHAPRAATQGLPALLIVWASVGACRGLRSRVLETLADASYAIYLFHWASLGAVKPIAAWLGSRGLFAAAAPWQQVTLLMLLHLAVAVLSGCLIHWWIERPLMRFAQHAFGNRRQPERASATA